MPPFLLPDPRIIMTADEIIAVASELDCGPEQTAVTFARMIAARCAQIAEEEPDAATAIREAFRI